MGEKVRIEKWCYVTKWEAAAREMLVKQGLGPIWLDTTTDGVHIIAAVGFILEDLAKDPAVLINLKNAKGVD